MAVSYTDLALFFYVMGNLLCGQSILCPFFPVLGIEKAGDLFRISCVVCRCVRRVFNYVLSGNNPNVLFKTVKVIKNS